MKKIIIILPFLFTAVFGLAQQQRIGVSIIVSTSPNPGKRQVSVNYTALNGDFKASDGTNKWNGQTITLGWQNVNGMTPSSPNPNITAFDAPSAFDFVDLFSNPGPSDITSFTLNQVGGTDDGNIYTAFVVNNNPIQTLLQGVTITVFTFDIPNTWTSGSIFLLETQPPGPPFGLSPVVLNSVWGQVWDGLPANSPLPIELTQFAARPLNATDALLNWETASEINSSHFEIERCTDEGKWKYVGKVEAAGQSSEELRYDYVDVRVFNADSPYFRFYYRLKMVDFDGSYEYSKVVSVEFPNDQFRLTITPNPNNGQFTLNIQNPEEAPLTARLVDSAGRVVRVFSTEEEVSKMTNEIPLSAGIYYLLAECGGETWQEKVVVQ
ncbi:MAG: T9SS type A sorting domain-containing protein [Saprospiraceae bacterium]|nr:T9SS type A sorting domain-containing protein [Saprospiraceae bacterium]MCF8249037.1 T9SS type A sorting domain-containing protein [Saprospiraceae bacterium]MCF8282662.1 T9SS type A sorting domain-containing protein [Bacteroidales bacterium]MCF8311059.1 T9SS type A sorting domain-containing protein [Saprospiraceae bacterium]